MEYVGLIVAVIFALMAVAYVVLHIYVAIHETFFKKSGFQKFIKDQGFKNYEAFRLEDGSYIVNDYDRGRIWIYNGNYSYQSWNNIRAVQLRVDDSTVFRTSVANTLGRAALGGIIAGGVGAVVGGLTGNRTGAKMVHRIDLIIAYNSSNTPYHKITFLDRRNGVDIFSDDFRDAEEQALYWSNLIGSYLPRGGH